MTTKTNRIRPVCTITSRVAALAAGLAVFVTVFPVQTQQNERRLAFVVGNDAYRDAPLKNGKNDARAIAAELRDVGFTVTPLHDATRDQFTTAFATFVDQLRANDVAVFYFAGHGVQVDGENYLIPASFTGSGPAMLGLNAIKASEVQKLMERARVRVLILDACRTNPFSGNRQGAGGLASMEARGSLIAMAAGPGEVASDNPDETNGLYTRELVKVLRVPGLALREVLFRVRQQVYDASNSKQFPDYRDQLLFDIVLRPAAAAGVSPPPSRRTLTPMPVPAGREPSAPRTNPVSASGDLTSDPDGAPMRLVPAGPFWMGTTQSEADALIAECVREGTIAGTASPAQYCRVHAFAGETPRHQVTLDAFYMDKYEVTTRRYAQFLAATRHLAPVAWSEVNSAAHAERPVIGVKKADAEAYCRWAGKRLPTEAEWEKAARGTDGRTYPWGNAAPNLTLAHYDATRQYTVLSIYSDWKGYGALAPVDSHSPGVSPYGIHHLAGNVHEYVSDFFGRDYYASSPSANPRGGTDNGTTSWRGGSWASRSVDLGAARRSWADSGLTADTLRYFGVRCVASV